MGWEYFNTIIPYNSSIQIDKELVTSLAHKKFTINYRLKWAGPNTIESTPLEIVIWVKKDLVSRMSCKIDAAYGYCSTRSDASGAQFDVVLQKHQS